jgi:hypothetical protein
MTFERKIGQHKAYTNDKFNGIGNLRSDPRQTNIIRGNDAPIDQRSIKQQDGPKGSGNVICLTTT